MGITFSDIKAKIKDGELAVVVKEKIGSKGSSEYARIKWHLEPVEKDLFAQKTQASQPIVFVKSGNQLFIGNICKQHIRITDPRYEHKCSTCVRLHAVSDDKGGCAKVREIAPSLIKYDWITLGIQTVNTMSDIFIVLECQHYQKDPDCDNDIASACAKVQKTKPIVKTKSKQNSIRGNNDQKRITLRG